MRRNPFEEIEELFDRMETQFETDTGSVAVDVVDRDEEYVLTADLPGYESEDIELRYSDGRLHLSAERDEAHDVTEAEFVRRERRHSSVDRTVTVPEQIDEEAIEASHNNGVLTVHLPKVDVADEGKEIDIE